MQKIKNVLAKDKNNILVYIVIFFTFLVTEPAGQFAGIYQRDLEQSLVLVGVVGAAAAMMAMVGHFAAGSISDHKGRKKPLLFLVAATVLFPLTLLFFSSPTGILIAKMIEGLVVSAFYTAMIAYLYDSNSMKHAGRVYTRAITAIIIAQLISPLWGGIIIENFGYQWLFSISCYIAIIPIILVYFLKNIKVTPQEKNFKGEFTDILEKPTFIKIWTTMTIISLSAGFIGRFFPIYLYEVIGLSYTQTGLFFSGVTLVLAASQPLLGWLTDRFKSRIIIPAGLFIMAISSVFLAGASSIISLFISRALLPIGMATSRTKGSALVAKITPKEEHALSHAMYKSSSSIGWTISNAVAPFLIASIGYGGVFRVLGVLSFFTAGAYAITYYHKEISHKKERLSDHIKHHHIFHFVGVHEPHSFLRMRHDKKK